MILPYVYDPCYLLKLVPVMCMISIRWKRELRNCDLECNSFHPRNFSQRRRIIVSGKAAIQHARCSKEMGLGLLPNFSEEGGDLNFRERGC